AEGKHWKAETYPNQQMYVAEERRRNGTAGHSCSHGFGRANRPLVRPKLLQRNLPKILTTLVRFEPTHSRRKRIFQIPRRFPPKLCPRFVAIQFEITRFVWLRTPVDAPLNFISP